MESLPNPNTYEKINTFITKRVRNSTRCGNLFLKVIQLKAPENSSVQCINTYNWPLMLVVVVGYYRYPGASSFLSLELQVKEDAIVMESNLFRVMESSRCGNLFLKVR